MKQLGWHKYEVGNNPWSINLETHQYKEENMMHIRLVKFTQQANHYDHVLPGNLFRSTENSAVMYETQCC